MAFYELRPGGSERATQPPPRQGVPARVSGRSVGVHSYG